MAFHFFDNSLTLRLFEAYMNNSKLESSAQERLLESSEWQLERLVNDKKEIEMMIAEQKKKCEELEKQIERMMVIKEYLLEEIEE